MYTYIDSDFFLRFDFHFFAQIYIFQQFLKRRREVHLNFYVSNTRSTQLLLNSRTPVCMFVCMHNNINEA